MPQYKATGYFKHPRTGNVFDSEDTVDLTEDEGREAIKEGRVVLPTKNKSSRSAASADEKK